MGLHFCATISLILDHINTIENILSLSIPEIEYIIKESKRPVPGLDGFFDYNGYHCDLEEGFITLALLVFTIERRLTTPHNQVQDPPRPVRVPRIKAFCREHQKLHGCLRIFQAEIDERQDYLHLAQNNGWYQGII